MFNEITPEEEERMKEGFYKDFPFNEEQLIQFTKEFLRNNQGLSDPKRFMADDFEFIGPVVGPLSKEQLTEALGSFKLEDAFPDANPRFHHFRADPLQPDRIWFTTAFVGTHTGYFGGGAIPPTKKVVRTPPQCNSVTFDTDGKVKRYTIGHVMDVGAPYQNTGGLGGVYGLLYGIGYPLPYPEARPHRKSLAQRIYQALPNSLRPLMSIIYPLIPKL